MTCPWIKACLHDKLRREIEEREGKKRKKERPSEKKLTMINIETNLRV